jgi:hypothetical protein
MPARQITFSEQEIQAIFGHEAAEDEDPVRLKEYYFKSAVYESVANELPLRILVGHKGVGKSALFQIAMAEDRDAGRLTLAIRPDDVLELGEGLDDFIQIVRSWKEGLSELIARRALQTMGSTSEDLPGRIKRVGGRLIDVVQASLKDPAAFTLDPARKAIAERFLKTSEMSIYVDDLDRGWQGRKSDIVRISALLNAIRDLSSENRGLRFRVSLRSDVYFLVRTSDESTDKIEGSVVWHSWANHEIYGLLAKRIATFFGDALDVSFLRRQDQGWLGTYLHRVFEPRFQGRGHWNDAPTHRVLMSLVRRRPRDLVKLCTLAGRDARLSQNSVIKTRNLQNIFEEYSQGRIQDTINEFRFELPDIDRLLFGMKPSKKEKVAKLGYVYTTASLLQKIRNIKEQGQFDAPHRRNLTDREIAAFLYKINFITARKEMADGSISRRFFEESRYLQSAFADFGFEWEVHPAYRWALQPDDPLGVYSTLYLGSDS